MKVAVGSKNPVKIQSTKDAFEKVWPEKDWDVVGVNVDSGVSDQPMSDKESIEGATNRAKRAMEAENADFGVGMEGGLQKINEKWFSGGWSAVMNKKGIVRIGASCKVQAPEGVIRLIEEGKELGEAVDEISGGESSGHKGGFFGFMTNGMITRKNAYVSGLILALSGFLHEDLW